MLYNDTSVLENHHCAVAFKLMKKDGCDVLEPFGKKKYHGIRRIIVDLESSTPTVRSSNKYYGPCLTDGRTGRDVRPCQSQRNRSNARKNEMYTALTF